MPLEEEPRRPPAQGPLRFLLGGRWAGVAAEVSPGETRFGLTSDGVPSGFPPFAEVEPVNHFPNPYETARDWGILPDGREWGSVPALQIDPDGFLYAIDSESGRRLNPGWREGLRIGRASDGEVLYFIPPHFIEDASHFPSGITVYSEGAAANVYAGEVGTGNPIVGITKYIRRFELEPVEPGAIPGGPRRSQWPTPGPSKTRLAPPSTKSPKAQSGSANTYKAFSLSSG